MSKFLRQFTSSLQDPNQPKDLSDKQSTAADANKDAGQVCAATGDSPTLSLDNPDFPEDQPWADDFKVNFDEKLIDVVDKISRGEMTAEEAMKQAATDATTNATTDAATNATTDAVADATTNATTDAAADATADAVVDANIERAVVTTGSEVEGGGLLGAVAPVAVPVAAGAAVFLAGEDSAVPEDEEQAMLAESRRQQAAREAAAKAASGDSTPAPGAQPADPDQSGSCQCVPDDSGSAPAP
jgi:hypothetical protein